MNDLIQEALSNIADSVAQNGLYGSHKGKSVHYKPVAENLYIEDIEAVNHTVVFIIANKGGTTFRRAVIEYRERDDRFIGYEENEFVGQALGREFEKYSASLSESEQLKQLYSTGKVQAFVAYLKLLANIK
jgi:hypothetical protein